VKPVIAMEVHITTARWLFACRWVMYNARFPG
jgi:hypothetical protein